MRVDSSPLNESDLVTIIAELQTAIAEIQLSTEFGNQKQTNVLAKQLLVLFNGLIYCLRLDDADFEDQTGVVGLNQSAQSLLETLKPIADIYKIKLELVHKSTKSDLIEIQPHAFEYITQSLGFGLLSCLQNHQNDSLRIKVVVSPQPQLVFSSENIDLLATDFARTDPIQSRNKLNTMSSGIHSGILIANLICDRVGVEFSLFHQAGKGVSLKFRRSRQLSLISGK